MTTQRHAATWLDILWCSVLPFIRDWHANCVSGRQRRTWRKSDSNDWRQRNETRKTREIQETRSQHKGSHRSTIMPYYHIGRNELICVAHPSTRRMAKLSLHRLRPDTTHTCVADRAWIRDILRRPAEHEQYAVGDILWDTRLQLTGSVIIHCSLKMTCMHIYYILFFVATIANDYEHKPQKKVIFLFDVTCELFMLKSIVTQE